MAGSVNKVILIGRLGKDPEKRSLPDGSGVVNFTLATSEAWSDRTSGERKERTEWHRCVVMSNDHLVRLAGDRLRKGDLVYLEGKLQTRKWSDQSGQERWVTEIILGRFNAVLLILESRSGVASDHDDRSDASPAAGQAQRAAANVGTTHRGAAANHAKTFGDAGGRLPDDEVPF